MQQLIGINTVIYCGATILGSTGLSISSSIAQAVLIGLVNLVFAWRVPETKNRNLEQIEREIRGEPQLSAQQLRERRQRRRDGDADRRSRGPRSGRPLTH